jgi:hypothetical protein
MALEEAHMAAAPKRKKQDQKTPPSPNANKATAEAPDVGQKKKGCAPSFLMEKRNEEDILCGRTPAEELDEYEQPEDEKEVGGEG